MTPDTTANYSGQIIEVTFTDDASWRAALTVWQVNNGGVLPLGGQYCRAWKNSDAAGNIMESDIVAFFIITFMPVVGAQWHVG